MNKLKIGCDIDNIINNLTKLWNEELNEKYNIQPNVKLEDIKEWNMSKAFPTLTIEQIIEPLVDDKLWHKLQPIKDSQKYLKLLNDNYELYLITSTDYRNISAKMKWLNNFFPFIDWEQIIVIKKKQMIYVDVLIDDAIHNLVDGDYIKICLDYPWNRNIKDKEHEINRVFDWQGIYSEIEKISNQFKQVEMYDYCGVII